MKFLRLPLRRKLGHIFAFFLLVGLVTLSLVLRSFWKKLPPNHIENLYRIYGVPWAKEPTPPIWMKDSIPEILNSARPLSSYRCPELHEPDLVWSPRNLTMARPKKIRNPFLLLATFSVAKDFTARAMLRGRRKDGLPERYADLVQSRFVIGALRDKDVNGTEERRLVESKLKAEQALWGDLILLEGQENMDDGKTYEFLQYLVQRGDRGGPRPQFVIKLDQDTLLHLPNVLDSLMPLDCNRGIYWGTSMGSCVEECFPFYFQGMAYGLSWPVVEFLARANLGPNSVGHTEDARTGAWIQSIDRATKALWERRFPGKAWRRQEEIRKIDVGRRLGGWRDWWTEGPKKVIGYHYLKHEEEWLEAWAVVARVLTEWTGGEEVLRRQ